MYDLSAHSSITQRTHYHFANHLKRSAADSQQKKKAPNSGCGPVFPTALSPESQNPRATKACKAFFFMASLSILPFDFVTRRPQSLFKMRMSTAIQLENATSASPAWRGTHPTRSGRRGHSIPDLSQHGKEIFLCVFSPCLTMITRPVTSLYTKLSLSQKPTVHGPCPLPCLADWSHRAKSIVQVCCAQARATWDELELMRLKESWYVTLVLKRASGAPVSWFLLDWVRLLLSWSLRGEFSIIWKKMRRVSLSSPS